MSRILLADEVPWGINKVGAEVGDDKSDSNALFHSDNNNKYIINKYDTYIISAMVIGIILVILTIIFGIYYCKNRRNKSKIQFVEEEEEETDTEVNEILIKDDR